MWERERQRKVLKKRQLISISKDGKSQQLGIELMNGSFSGWVALCKGSKPKTVLDGGRWRGAGPVCSDVSNTHSAET